MGVHQTHASDLWFDEDDEGQEVSAKCPQVSADVRSRTAQPQNAVRSGPQVSAECPEKRTVWARVGTGKYKRVPLSVAQAEGWEIDDRPGRGGWGEAGHGGVRREFMGVDERREVFEKTGIPVHDRDDMRKALAAKGIRHAEKGEKAHGLFDALRDCAEGHAIDRNYDFGAMDPFGTQEGRSKEPFDYKRRFREHCQRLGVSPD